MKKKLKQITLIFILLILMSNITFASVKYYNSNYTNPKTSSNYKYQSTESLKLTFEDFRKAVYFLFGSKTTNLKSNMSDNQKQIINTIAIIFTVFIIFYWIFLLLKYEKENIISFEPCDDFDILNKYNPLIAGCLVDNREVLSRDIIAILVNLINKEVLKLDIVPLEFTGMSVDENKKYKYILTRIRENEHKMDRIEAFVHGIFFNYSYNNENTIRLDEALDEINKDKTLNNKIQELNNIACNELNKLGANIHGVPVLLQFFNYFVLFASIIFSILHFISNSLDVTLDSTTFVLFLAAFVVFLFIFPLLVIAFRLFLLQATYMKRLINKINEQFSGQKIISTSIAIFAIIFILIFLSCFLLKNFIIVIDILMIGFAFLIVKTDNLMSKNNDAILSDYYNLNAVKYKIEEYSMLDIKDVHFIVLWKQYLSYAISFGFAKQVIGKIRKTYDDDFDIQKLIKLDSLFEVFDFYFNIVWGIDFTPDNTKHKNTKPKYSSGNYHYFFPEEFVDTRSDFDFWFGSKK